MNWLQDLFSKPYASHHQVEVEKMIADLIQIGKRDDFLSERPGGGFNIQCRHVRTIEIGKRLHEMGGLPLMEYVYRRVRRKTSRSLGEHLQYAWDGVGAWIA